MKQAAFEEVYTRISRGSIYKENQQNVGYFVLSNWENLPGIRHGFSARTGGVSTGCFSSLNLSFTRPEDRGNVLENYKRFCLAADIPESSMVMDTYNHGTTVLLVDRRDCGKGYTRDSLPYCDGLVTNDPAVTLITGHADCMAFYFYDPVKRAIGLCHAGWRGALHRIGREVVGMLTACFGSKPEDILAGLGPAICRKHFEVGTDVADAFEAAFPNTPLRDAGIPGKAYVDLWQAACTQFLDSGILPEHISMMDVCTYEDPRLYSYRRDKPTGGTGGMSAFLRLV